MLSQRARYLAHGASSYYNQFAPTLTPGESSTLREKFSYAPLGQRTAARVKETERAIVSVILITTITSGLPVTRTLPRLENALPVHSLRTGNVSTESECGLWDGMKPWRFRSCREVLMSHNPCWAVDSAAVRKRSEREANTHRRSKVVVGEKGDAGAMRNGDGQTAAHPRIGNSGKTV